MNMSAGWRISGIVNEARILTSQKNESWKGYVTKVASLGLTAEISIDAQMYGRLHAGQIVNFEGRFEDNQGRLRLVATVLETPQPLTAEAIVGNAVAAKAEPARK